VTDAGIRRSTIGDFDAIVLENGLLRAVVLPTLGGRVWELLDKARGRQWIWNRGPENLRAQPVGASYDDVWAGGWEELFPNDAPGRFEDRDLPDHGEWWATGWEVVELIDDPEPRVRLSAPMHVVRASCTKEFSLTADGATLVVRYRIRSHESRPFHFLFKQHLPVGLTPDCLLQLPGGIARCVDPAFGSHVTDPAEFSWPWTAGGTHSVDLRRIPAPSSRAREFLYVRSLPAPWCGVDDLANRASLRMKFDATQLPYVWLFLTYGGWQDYYTAVLEPCTNCPKDLAEAVRLGQSARLEPGEEFATQVSVTLSALLPMAQDVPQNMRPST